MEEEQNRGRERKNVCVREREGIIKIEERWRHACV